MKKEEKVVEDLQVFGLNFSFLIKLVAFLSITSIGGIYSITESEDVQRLRFMKSINQVNNYAFEIQ